MWLSSECAFVCLLPRVGFLEKLANKIKCVHTLVLCNIVGKSGLKRLHSMELENKGYSMLKSQTVYLKLQNPDTSYYKSSSVCLFVCLSVCLFVPYLLRGPLTDLRQTWWVYVGGPRNCPWGVLFRKGQRLDGSTGHFHFPLYYICASLTPHSCKRRLCCYCI